MSGKRKPIQSPQQASVRFWPKVEKQGECWIWKGAVISQARPYGQFGFNRSKILAHRFSYLLHYGTLPIDKDILHSCDTPRCVNPAHLHPGTHLENMSEAKIRGRLVSHVGEKHGCAVLSEADVIAIRNRKEISPIIAKEFGISDAHVRTIRRRIVWRHI